MPVDARCGLSSEQAHPLIPRLPVHLLLSPRPHSVRFASFVFLARAVYFCHASSLRLATRCGVRGPMAPPH